MSLAEIVFWTGLGVSAVLALAIGWKHWSECRRLRRHGVCPVCWPHSCRCPRGPR